MIILSGVLIIGGEISSDYDNISTVELWAPGSDGVQCKLPNMPVLLKSRPSLDSILVGGNNSHWFTLACDSGTCLKFSKGKWELHRTYEARDGHTSAVFYTNSGHGNIILAGGPSLDETSRTTDIIPDDHDQDTIVKKGFHLRTDRWFHCSIQLDKDRFILTGGMWGDSNEVREYLYKGGDYATVHYLPHLSEGLTT